MKDLNVDGNTNDNDTEAVNLAVVVMAFSGDGHDCGGAGCYAVVAARDECGSGGGVAGAVVEGGGDGNGQ